MCRVGFEDSAHLHSEVPRLVIFVGAFRLQRLNVVLEPGVAGQQGVVRRNEGPLACVERLPLGLLLVQGNLQLLHPVVITRLISVSCTYRSDTEGIILDCVTSDSVIVESIGYKTTKPCQGRCTWGLCSQHSGDNANGTVPTPQAEWAEFHSCNTNSAASDVAGAVNCIFCDALTESQKRTLARVDWCWLLCRPTAPAPPPC